MLACSWVSKHFFELFFVHCIAHIFSMHSYLKGSSYMFLFGMNGSCYRVIYALLDSPLEITMAWVSLYRRILCSRLGWRQGDRH